MSIEEIKREEPPTVTGKPTLKEKLNKLMEQYGPAVLVTTLLVFLLQMAIFAAVRRFGVTTDNTAGDAGMFGAAYFLLKPVRIAIILVLTPFVAKVMNRARKVPPPA